MIDYIRSRVLAWVFAGGTGLTAADVMAFGTGVLAFAGAGLMLASGYYSYRVNRSKWDRENGRDD